MLNLSTLQPVFYIQGLDENFAKQNLASAFALRVYFVGIYDELRRTIAYIISLRGAPTPVRTGNLQLRRLALYPIELWALDTLILYFKATKLSLSKM